MTNRKENIPTGDLQCKCDIDLEHCKKIQKKLEEELKFTKESLDLLKQKLQVSEHKQRETCDYLDNILTVIPGHVYWLDSNGFYLGCNEDQAKSLGFESRYDIVGTKNTDFFAQEIATVLDLNNELVMQSGKLISIEENAIYHGEKKTFVSHKAPLRSKDGTIIGLVGTSLEITERKRLENELRLAKTRAESAQQIMETISNSIAHELRTPLSSISAYAQGIKKHLEVLIAGYNAAKKEGLDVAEINKSHLDVVLLTPEKIIAEINSLFTIIDMLLVNIGDLEIKETNYETCSILNCVIKALNRYPFCCGERELVNFAYNNDFMFKGREILIVHVLFNLLKNAFYFIGSVNKGKIYIHVKSEDEHNILLFKDTSVGIDKNILPHIFERYFSKTKHGTGIGLLTSASALQIFI